MTTIKALAPVGDPALIQRILACTEHTILFARLTEPITSPLPDRRATRVWYHAPTIEPGRFELSIAPPRARGLDLPPEEVDKLPFEVVVRRVNGLSAVYVLLTREGCVRRTHPLGRDEDPLTWEPLFGKLVLTDTTHDFVDTFDDDAAHVLVELLDSGVITREHVTRAHAAITERRNAEDE